MVNVKMKTIIKGTVKATCPTHSRTDISVRDVTSVIDEPIERDGTNLGPSPTEAGIAALVGCTNTIGNKCAAKLGVDIGHLEITAVYSLDRRGVMLMEEIDLPFTEIDLTIACSGSASQDELAQVAAETAKYCALSKMFRSAGTKITENWVKA